MGLKTVVLNSERMNYDGKLDLSVLSSEVKEYASTEQDQILERVQGMDVVVTKEMPVDGDTIARFPDSVQLICEAGTGYNNIDIEAARARGYGMQYSGLQHRACGPYSDYDDSESQFLHADPAGNAGQGRPKQFYEMYAGQSCGSQWQGPGYCGSRKHWT